MQNYPPHGFLNNSITPPFPEHSELAYFAMGCFWGAERLFWQLSGVYSTAVGYAGGKTDAPGYYQVCSGKTGHTETVQVVFFPKLISYNALLKTFWEGHNPTQGMRQGNDIGSQYRSAIFTVNKDQQQIAKSSRNKYQNAVSQQLKATITTEIKTLNSFWLAEAEHQQYLHHNPEGYCGLKGVGISCNIQ